MSWTSETFAQNQNANAIRWGTLYNFRFDSDRPPQTTNATVGFYKTGAPILVQIQGPDQGPVLPTLSINDVTLTEGNAGTTTANFTVTLSSSSLDTVSVQYATANGLAKRVPITSAPVERLTSLRVKRRNQFPSQLMEMDWKN